MNTRKQLKRLFEQRPQTKHIRTQEDWRVCLKNLLERPDLHCSAPVNDSGENEIGRYQSF